MKQSSGILEENKKIKGAKEVIFDSIKFKSRLEMTCYKKFKEAGYIIKGKIDRQWLINPILIPQIIKDRIQITLVLRIKDEEN